MPVDPMLLQEMEKRGLSVPQAAPQRKQADPDLMQEMQKRGIGQPDAATSPFSAEAGQEQRRAGMTHGRTENLPGGRAAGVDYDVGTSFLDRMALGQASNDEERQLYLTKSYGAGNVFKDEGGKFFIRDKSGKLVSPEGGSLGGRVASTLAAEAPTIAGATMGGMVGGPPGAMVGGAMGKTATEMGKLLQGRSASTIGQKAQDIGLTGLEMGAGEKVGRMVSGIPSAAGRFFREKIAGVTPESRQMAAGIAQLGGSAPLRSVAPGLTSPIQKQDISSRLGADWLAERNNPVVQKRLRGIIDSIADDPASSERMAAEILDPTSAISSREAGDVVQNAVRSNVSAMQGDVNALHQRAQQSLDTQIKNIEGRLRQPTGSLGADVAEAFQRARRDFSNQAQAIYGQIDPIVGNIDIVPTGPINKAARELLDAMPKTKAGAGGQVIFEDPKVLDSVRKLTQLEPKIRFRDAQQIRSTLGDWATQPDLTGSLPRRQFEQLRAAIDQAFTLAGTTDPAAAPAVDLLRKGDAFYKDGIRKFENLAINRMAKDIRDGITPDPGVVANTILRDGQSQQAAQIKKMLPPELWQKVAGADWKSMLSSVTNPETGMVSSRKLASEVAARDEGGMLDLTYGPMARDIKLYSKRLSAMNQEIPANELNPGSFGTVMRVMEVRQARLDAYMRDNYLSALAKPGAESDKAVNWIVQPGNEGRLISAEKEFGQASPQMKAIRTQALKELLNEAVVPTERGVGSTIEGPGIEKALSAYTPRQQKILFPDGLADDMRYLAKQIRAMFPAKGDQIGGALIAGAVRNAPLLGSMSAARSGAITGGALLGIPGFLGGPAGAAAGAGIGGTMGAIAGGLAGGRLARTAYYEGLGWIYSHPTTVRVLTEGLKSGPTKTATRETVRMIFRSSLMGTLPRSEGVEDPGVNPMAKPKMALRSSPGPWPIAPDRDPYVSTTGP